ncbi:MAG: NAD(+)/NADH kinase [Myxococcota bacterium]
MKRVLVVYKRTTLQRYEARGDDRVKTLLAMGDRSVENLESAHASHLETLRRTKRFLLRRDVDATFAHRVKGLDARWDLVVTLGGDGTLLWSSHLVDGETPMLSVNSAPMASVGYFAGASRDDVEEGLDAALTGRMRATRLTRMEVRVDGEVRHRRVLNDVLWCHASPAATTRYLIRHGDVEEEHRSSGAWVGPAAGSTAAQRSAGGKVLPLRSKKLQFVVREPYQPGDTRFRLAKGLVAPDDELVIKSKIRDGRLFFDGAQKVAEIDVGAEIVMRRSPEPLQLLGLTRAGASSTRSSEAPA